MNCSLECVKLSWVASYCCVSVTKHSMGSKGFIWVTPPNHRGESGTEAQAEAETGTVEGSCLLTCSPGLILSLLSYTTQDNLPRMGWAHPHQPSIKKMPHSCVHTLIPRRSSVPRRLTCIESLRMMRGWCQEHHMSLNHWMFKSFT